MSVYFPPVRPQSLYFGTASTAESSPMVVPDVQRANFQAVKDAPTKSAVFVVPGTRDALLINYRQVSGKTGAEAFQYLINLFQSMSPDSKASKPGKPQNTYLKYISAVANPSSWEISEIKLAKYNPPTGSGAIARDKQKRAAELALGQTLDKPWKLMTGHSSIHTLSPGPGF